MGEQDLSIRARGGRIGQASHLRGVEAVRDQLELVLGLVRIPGTNQPARGLCDRHNGRGVFYRSGLCLPGELVRTLTIAEREAYELERCRDPLIAEIDDDG